LRTGQLAIFEMQGDQQMRFVAGIERAAGFMTFQLRRRFMAETGNTAVGNGPASVIGPLR